MDNVFEEIRKERQRQIEKWGEQKLPMLNVPFTEKGIEEKSKAYKAINDNSESSWFSVLQEEVSEAFAETDPKKQREEMIQVAAVAVQIIEYLDRRVNSEINNNA